MPPIQTALAIVGLAKQAAKGTPTAEPTFVEGMTDGGAFKVDVDQSPEDQTLDASRLAVDANRGSVVPGLNYSTRAHAKSLGLKLYAALGAIATVGAGPYTHTITPATDLPYVTGWGKFNSVLHRVQDAKVDELNIEWEEAGPLTVEATLIGTVMGFPGTITPVVDDSAAAYFRAAGGTFKLDTASAVPVTAPIKGGSVKIANGVSPVILSASVVPDDVAVAHQEITVGLTLVVSNLDEWRKVITGTSGGATPSQVAIFGSFETKFVIDANTDLILTAPRVPFMCDFPEADAGGGAAELELEGVAVLPAAGAAFTATLRNAHVAY